MRNPAFALLTAMVLAAPIPLVQADTPLIFRENIGWANLWFPHVKENNLPHVLLIGDSIWATTTPVTVGNHPDQIDQARTERVKARNAIAHAFVPQAGIEEDDLFTPVLLHPELHDNGGVHYTKVGVEVQGAQVASILEKALTGIKAPGAAHPKSCPST